MKEIAVKRHWKKIVAGVAALAALALGGAALAGATSGGSDDTGDRSAAIPASALGKAKAVALDATGGGETGESELDGEKGATYEVEVTKPNGDQVDVRLDRSFEVVAMDGDEEDGEDD
jgi:uncharacterized membrane protein YkoI